MVICGEREVFKIDPWLLTSDAVPTIFPHEENDNAANPTPLKSAPLSVESSSGANDDDEFPPIELE